MPVRCVLLAAAALPSPIGAHRTALVKEVSVWSSDRSPTITQMHEGVVSSVPVRDVLYEGAGDGAHCHLVMYPRGFGGMEHPVAMVCDHVWGGSPAEELNIVPSALAPGAGEVGAFLPDGLVVAQQGAYDDTPDGCTTHSIT
eukprot:gene29783-57253_t